MSTRVNEKVYLMKLIKKEDLGEFNKHTEKLDNEGYTVFGIFDFLTISEVKDENENGMKEILNIPLKIPSNGDALVQTISLFESNDCKNIKPFLITDESVNSEKSFESCYLQNNVTLINLIKLDSRAVFHIQNNKTAKKTGIETLMEIKNEISAIIKSLPYNQLINFKCFFSLGTYDIILFLSSEKPIYAVDTLVHIKTKCPKLGFSTSFFIFDYKTNNNWDAFNEKYGTILAKDRIGIRVCVAARENVSPKMLRETVKECLEINTDDGVLTGTALGDEDIILSIKNSTFFHFLTMFFNSPENKNYIFGKNIKKCKESEENDRDKNDENWIIKKIRRLNSTPAYFELEGLICENEENNFINYEPAYKSDLENYCTTKEKRHEVLKKLHSEVDDLVKKANVPEICKYPIHNVLETCRNLKGLGSHQVTAQRFLDALKIGMIQHIECMNNNSEYIKHELSIIKFANNLSFALGNVLNSSSVGISRLAELYSVNSHHKLLSSYRSISKDIYSVLPLKDDEDNILELVPFVCIGKSTSVECQYYFRMHDDYCKSWRLASIDIPSPLFLDLKESYNYILHEIAHLQHNYNGTKINDALRDTVFSYISLVTIHNASKEGVVYTFEQIDDAINYLKSIQKFNNEMNNKKMRLNKYLNELGNAIEEATRELKNNNSLLSIQLYNCMNHLIKNNIKNIISFIRHVFMEARSDVLMIQMAGNFSIEKYIGFWDSHFKLYGNDMSIINNREDLIYRFCFVLSYYDDDQYKNDVNLGEIFQENKNNSFNFIYKMYKKYKYISLPFTEYIARCTKNKDESLYEQIKKLDGWELSGANWQILNQQIEFHINHWFKDLMNTESKIVKPNVEY
ncbi:MAG: hypothetical protein FWB88_01700 [Defluviitaleaceae bacterium]|nr:hypothetical protein [Defluviitaleaceae bacterium]MCL2239436.1 hypothetical protein [Defluviitaleaceae bacterium]